MILRDEPMTEEGMSISSASGTTSPALSSIILDDATSRLAERRFSNGTQSSRGLDDMAVSRTADNCTDQAISDTQNSRMFDKLTGNRTTEHYRDRVSSATQSGQVLDDIAGIRMTEARTDRASGGMTEACNDQASSGTQSRESSDVTVARDEVEKLSKEKSKVLKGSDDQRWRESIRQQMEAELDQRVRDALESPPPPRHPRQLSADSCKKLTSSRHELEHLNAHVLLDLSDKERAYLKSRRWKALQAKRQMQRYVSMNYASPQSTSRIEAMFRDELSKSNQDEFPGVFGLTSFSEGVKDLNEIHRKPFEKFGTLRQLHKQYYTKEGFLNASRNGRFPDGTLVDKESDGSYEDRYGVIRNQFGPFWPNDWGPLYPAPKFLWNTKPPIEPLYYFFKNQNYPTVENQVTPYTQKWRGVLIVYDSERSSRDHCPNPVPEGCCPSLHFESRFESGNLRQARRVGQFEYELVLKTDLYTNRHTQWYYFRVQNAVPGVTYRFRIVNLLKRDSLYNYGMRPLVYSESDAKTKGTGWYRTGHHISYSRNVMHLHCPLLMRGFAFYELEFQMDFPNENDTYYLSHCYPYTFTDLKDDLESLLNDSARQNHVQREVMCETRAGNSCFLVTVTNFDQPEEVQDQKKAVVITARVHPGESQASWMMKGVLDYITGPDKTAQELRDKFIFKIVPMLNPDGVIVGNYRCSLSARDLNRNYRHPRKESFPTVWHTKNMIETVLQKHEVILYCDLHGHSRKHNVFMYGNNTATDDPENNNNGLVGAKAFLNERLFPWLMSQKSPEKFSFPFCKFNIKRCKEATGRVVMWRQMKIHNSFTLEATFSGTAMNKNLEADECRHFNIADYMEMGQILCQSVLEYQQTQENKGRQTEIALEMTRFLTCQVLERRRGVANYRMPNLRAFMKEEQIVNKMEDGEITARQEQPMDEDTESQSGDDMNGHDTQTPLPTDRGKKSKDKQHQQQHLDSKTNGLSKVQMDNMLETENMKTMDGCLEILAQLSMADVLEESDSSDSDSESEAEMKPPVEQKSKKKKRKSKKQRDKEQQERKGGSGSSDKKEERKLSALPTISGSHSADNRTDGSSKSQGLRESKRDNKKDQAVFVSKYEGRKNGGIPCFAEERSVERAAKRMAEMKKRSDEEKQREMAFFTDYIGYPPQCDSLNNPFPKLGHIPMPPVEVKCIDDSGLCQCGPPRAGMPVLRRSLTNDELQRRLQVALNEGTSNIAQTLVGFNVRTGYTHADSFRDLAPSVNPAGNQQHTQTQQNSSSDMSDSEGEIINMIPVTARATPFHQDNLTTITSPPLGPPHNNFQPSYKKHLSLRGPTLRSVSRQVSNSASPIGYAHHTNMIRAEMLHSSSRTDEKQPSEKKKNSSGPLVAKQNLNADMQLDYSPKDKRTQSAWTRGMTLL